MAFHALYIGLQLENHNSMYSKYWHVSVVEFTWKHPGEPGFISIQLPSGKSI